MVVNVINFFTTYFENICDKCPLVFIGTYDIILECLKFRKGKIDFKALKYHEGEVYQCFLTPKNLTKSS